MQGETRQLKPGSGDTRAESPETQGRLPDGVRAPAVAGSFYPASPAEVLRKADELLSTFGAPEVPRTGDLRALVVPHAGWVYSGPTAARAFALLRQERARRAEEGAAFRRVVLIGPPHHVPVAGFALSGAREWEVPGARFLVDAPRWQRVETERDVQISDAAHLPEHSLEVELPFLRQALGDEVELLPILVGGAAPERVAELLSPWLDDPETLLVVSTDLSHFLDYESAELRDQRTVERLLTAQRPDLGPRDACGAASLNGLIEVLRATGWERELLHRENSADQIGTRDRVVGYASLAVFAPPAPGAPSRYPRATVKTPAPGRHGGEGR